MNEDRCWFCGRTKEQLIKEDITGAVDEAMDEKHDVLVKIDSTKWVNIPSVCVVCLYLLTEHIINMNVAFEEDHL